MRCKVIAEAGVNHNGNLKIAKQLINIAAKAGADFVKFQSFKVDNLVTKNAIKARYQIKNTKNFKESQYSMLKKFQLNENQHVTLINHCIKCTVCNHGR